MIRQLFQQGLSKSEIARRVGLNRKTVHSALKQESVPKYERIKKVSKLERFKNYICSRLESYNLTAQKLFNEIKTQGYQGGYGIVNNYVRTQKRIFYKNVVLRFETLPGEQSQVDWGYFGEFYDYEKRKLVRLCCFFMVLGYSRMRFIHFLNQMIQNTF